MLFQGRWKEVQHLRMLIRIRLQENPLQSVQHMMNLASGKKKEVIKGFPNILETCLHLVLAIFTQGEIFGFISNDRSAIIWGVIASIGMGYPSIHHMGNFLRFRGCRV
jgi:hypothetical protein